MLAEENPTSLIIWLNSCQNRPRLKQYTAKLQPITETMLILRPGKGVAGDRSRFPQKEVRRLYIYGNEIAGETRPLAPKWPAEKQSSTTCEYQTSLLVYTGGAHTVEVSQFQRAALSRFFRLLRCSTKLIQYRCLVTDDVQHHTGSSAAWLLHASGYYVCMLGRALVPMSYFFWHGMDGVQCLDIFWSTTYCITKQIWASYYIYEVLHSTHDHGVSGSGVSGVLLPTPDKHPVPKDHTHAWCHGFKKKQNMTQSRQWL